MKFKFKTQHGWSDLVLQHDKAVNDKLSVCIDRDKTVKAKDRSTFILVQEGDDGAAIHLTRRQLRKFAEAILKELSK